MTGGDGNGKQRAFSPGSELAERENKTWMRENVDVVEQKARDREWKSAVRWKWYGGWNGHAGWSLSPPRLSLCLSTSLPLSLSPREADTSLHPFDRSQKGGWIEEWRGVKERGWAEKKEGEGRMSSRRTSKCSPRRSIGRARDTQTAVGHTHKHGCRRFSRRKMQQDFCF